MTAPKRKRGRPPSGEPTRQVRLAPRITDDEHELLERAAERLRRQTGQQHTASSVLRDGGLEHARRVVEG